MKIIHSAIFVLLSAASMTGAQAHDSFSFGFNVGAPPVVFYNPPVVYYSAVPRYYSYPPVVSYQYYGDGRRDYDRGWGREEHAHHSWGRERREHGDWNRGGWGRGHDD